MDNRRMKPLWTYGWAIGVDVGMTPSTGYDVKD